MSTGGQLGAHALSEKLADRIDKLAAQLLAHGVRRGNTWRCGSVAGEEGQSLCLWLDGPRRGQWRDYAAGEHGDALDLIAASLRLGARDAYRWGCGWLGLGEIGDDQRRRLESEAEVARERRRREAERAAVRNQQNAKLVWLAATPLAVGDAGWRYLAGRGIEIQALPSLPRAMRTHPALWNPDSRRHWPALVAAICGPGGAHVNTHRIWLEAHPDGTVRKAPIERPKLSMPGGYAGGCVRLWQGASRHPWKAMPEGETLLAGEGIEDVMTIVCAQPEWRAAAVLSVSSLAGLVLPPTVTRLVWLAQNDAPGSSAARALGVALEYHRRVGRRVFTLRPPPDVKDVNELVGNGADE